MAETIARSERRRVPRFPLFLPASVRSGSGAGRVHLRNLSCSGALAEGLRPGPPPGSPVTVSHDDLLLEAEVVWSQGRRFGLHFREPLATEALLARLGRGRR